MNLENCSASCRYSSIANYIRSLVNSIANALLLITWTNNKFGHTLVSNTYGAFDLKEKNGSDCFKTLFVTISLHKTKLNCLRQ